MTPRKRYNTHQTLYSQSVASGCEECKCADTAWYRSTRNAIQRIRWATQKCASRCYLQWVQYVKWKVQKSLCTIPFIRCRFLDQKQCERYAETSDTEGRRKRPTTSKETLTILTDVLMRQAQCAFTDTFPSKRTLTMTQWWRQSCSISRITRIAK